MFKLFSTTSFFSIWYWALLILVWTLICQRTLGVPHDMLLRAARLPAVAERVDYLALMTAQRLLAPFERLAVPIAALTGFGVAMLAGIGFGFDVEAAEALLVLLAPMGIVGLATLRLARVVRGGAVRGPALRRLLARRRRWNQIIAVAAMLATAILSLRHHPNLFLP